MQYAMAIDLTRCIGCHACSVACKSKNNLPNDVWWNRVVTEGGNHIDTASGTFPDSLTMEFVPISCQHCLAPACITVCPSDAIYRREDGIVIQNNENCIGCELCIAACPYEARIFYQEEPEYYVDFALGDWDAPKHEVATSDKCTFCVNRIDRGEVPACMALCPARARYWGDLDDPESEISKYIEGKNCTKLLEDKGTGPTTIYIRK